MEQKREIDLCAYTWDTYEKMVPALIDIMKGYGYTDLQMDWVGDGFIKGCGRDNSLSAMKAVAHSEIKDTDLSVVYYLRLQWRKENFVIEAMLQDEGMDRIYWMFSLKCINYPKKGTLRGRIFSAECAFFYERDLTDLSKIEAKLKQMTVENASDT